MQRRRTASFARIGRVAVLTGFLIAEAFVVDADATVVRYVAPTVRGNGSGTSPENAARYYTGAFWVQVNNLLAGNDVSVQFLPGTYDSGTVWLTNVGHVDHRLTLAPQVDDSVVFDGSRQWHFRLQGAQNVTLRGMTFTGATQNFAIHMEGSAIGAPTQNILLEQNRFIDLNNAQYGAIGISGASSHVTIRDSVFERVGFDSHAHMIYTSGQVAAKPRDIIVAGNHFEDSSGDYVRFSNGSERAFVYQNTFKSNSVARNRPFVAMPLFNTANPGQYAFGSEFTIQENHFEYFPWTTQDWDRGYAVAFSHYGFDPSGERHLLTPAQANVLRNGTAEQRTAMLRDVVGIDPAQIVMGANTFVNEAAPAVYGASASYGSSSRGWEGFIPIDDLLQSPTVLAGVGDYDGDGVVDGADFLSWQRSFGVEGLNIPADGNLDRVVDGGDLAVWKQRFSASSASPSVAAVPEPCTSTAMSVFCSLLALACFRPVSIGRPFGEKRI